MQSQTGIPKNKPKSYELSLTKYDWEFQNDLQLVKLPPLILGATNSPDLESAHLD